MSGAPGGGFGAGREAYASLGEVPEPIDLVDVFRAPEYVDKIVEECLTLKLPAIWLQLDVVNVPAAERARAAGMTVVMNRCRYQEWPPDPEAQLFRRRRP